MGPASNTEERLEALIQAGMNVARLNFSHGEHAIHGQTIANVRKVDEKLGTHTALLADLQGPSCALVNWKAGRLTWCKEKNWSYAQEAKLEHPASFTRIT